MILLDILKNKAYINKNTCEYNSNPICSIKNNICYLNNDHMLDAIVVNTSVYDTLDGNNKILTNCAIRSLISKDTLQTFQYLKNVYTDNFDAINSNSFIVNLKDNYCIFKNCEFINESTPLNSESALSVNVSEKSIVIFDSCIFKDFYNAIQVKNSLTIIKNCKFVNCHQISIKNNSYCHLYNCIFDSDLYLAVNNSKLYVEYNIFKKDLKSYKDNCNDIYLSNNFTKKDYFDFTIAGNNKFSELASIEEYDNINSLFNYDVIDSKINIYYEVNTYAGITDKEKGIS